MKKEIRLIKLFDKEYQVLISRKKIKNTYIRVNNNRITVSTNYYTPYVYIESLIKKNQNKIVEMINNNSILPNQLLYLGKKYEVFYQEAKQFSYEFINDKIYFYTKLKENDTLDLFYKEEAKTVLPLRLKLCFEHFSKFKKIHFPELSIRKMKIRFGTCYYTRNRICLNSYLVKYNEEVIDYVIYHELCHFIHHNHGKSFYSLLEKVCPDYKIIKNNLNK